MNELLLCFYPSGGRVVFRDLFKTDSGGSGFGEVQTLKSQERKDNMKQSQPLKNLLSWVCIYDLR